MGKLNGDPVWQFSPEILKPYDTRFLPQPVPEDDVCDAPFVRLCFNAKYASHVDGAIGRLLERDAWEGTDEEIDRAIQAVTEILSQLGENCMSCGCDESTTVIETRVNEDGTTEISTDGGETWIPNPDDPRNTAPQYPPLSGSDGDEKKCKAANNVTDYMQDKVDEFGDTAELGGGLIAVAGALIAFLLAILSIATGFLPLVPLFLTLAAAIVAAGKDAYLAEFTGDIWDDFTCIIYCHCQPDGSFTHADVLDILTDIDSTFTGNVALTFTSSIKGLQELGLTNAARTGLSTEIDCSSCGCGSCTTDGWLTGSAAGGEYYPPSFFVNGCGNEIGRTDTTITVEAQFDSVLYGLYRVDLVHDDLTACNIDGSYLTGFAEYHRGYPEGVTDPGAYGTTFPDNFYRCIFLSASPFTILITIGEP